MGRPKNLEETTVLSIRLTSYLIAGFREIAFRLPGANAHQKLQGLVERAIERERFEQALAASGDQCGLLAGPGGSIDLVCRALTPSDARALQKTIDAWNSERTTNNPHGLSH